MNFILLTVGKTHIPFVVEGIKDYCRRLERYVPFSIVELPDVRNAGAMPAETQKQREGEMMMSKFQPSDFVILLDEKGKEYSSMEFSGYISKLQSSGRKRAVFVVGGPYGFSPAVYDRADAKVSLSRMTFNHEMVRLFFVEQLYRAHTILRGEPYHHE